MKLSSSFKVLLTYILTCIEGYAKERIDRRRAALDGLNQGSKSLVQNK
jgi:hypothetical protein